MTTQKAKILENIDDSIFNENIESSLVNMVPDRLRPILYRVRELYSSSTQLPEMDLRYKVKPTEMCYRLRLQFWDEYNLATRLNRKMSLASMLNGVCSTIKWNNQYEPNDWKMIWIFTPPASYATQMRYILNLGVERLVEIMSLPIVDSNGKVDSKTVVNILKAFQLVDNRVKGAVAQKLQIHQQSLNLHKSVHGDANFIDGRPLESYSLEELETIQNRISRGKKAERLLTSRAEEHGITLDPVDTYRDILPVTQSDEVEL